MRRHANTKAGVFGFSAGALVGAGLAFLYAPKTGHEVREKVSQATGDALSKMKRRTGETREKMNRSLKKGERYAAMKAATLSPEAHDEEQYYN